MLLRLPSGHSVHTCIRMEWEANEYYFPGLLQKLYTEFQFSHCALQLPPQLQCNICSTISHKKSQVILEKRSTVNKTSSRKHSKHHNPAYSTQISVSPLGTAVCTAVEELLSVTLSDIWVKTQQETKEKGKQVRKALQLGRCLRVMASKSSQQIAGSKQSYHKWF